MLPDTPAVTSLRLPVAPANELTWFSVPCERLSPRELWEIWWLKIESFLDCSVFFVTEQAYTTKLNIERNVGQQQYIQYVYINTFITNNKLGLALRMFGCCSYFGWPTGRPVFKSVGVVLNAPVSCVGGQQAKQVVTRMRWSLKVLLLWRDSMCWRYC